MTEKRWGNVLNVILIIFICAGLVVCKAPETVHADGFVSFETGVDGQVIRSSIPGLVFTNTNGYDWVYGDWRTGFYNGKYPNGQYTSNGNFFAWLGAMQGDGRIDFTSEAGATYLSVWVSAGEPVTMRGYTAFNIQVAEATLPAANVNTGQMANLIVRAPLGLKLDHVIISGTANYWLIDDLSTDAGGVPEARTPVIFVPGIAGTKLFNDENQDGNLEEVWPGNITFSLDDDFMLAARLAPNGVDPFMDTPRYNTVRTGDPIMSVMGQAVYQTLADFFVNQRGYTLGTDFILCPYDWRKSLDVIAYDRPGDEDKTLGECINKALRLNPGATKVNILAHSMGGLLARQYITASDANARKVNRLVTLGTPYLGSPKIVLAGIGETCFIDILFGTVCITNKETVSEVIMNHPSHYQLSPLDGYFKVYPSGLINRTWDSNDDGRDDGWLSLSDTLGFYKKTSTELVDPARALLQPFQNGWNNNANRGVQVYMIVGDQLPTITTFEEDVDDPWWQPGVQQNIIYRTRAANGDGTVPLHSADLRNLSLNPAVDLSGNASVFYFKVNHGDLSKNEDVLRLAADIFDTPNSAPYQLPSKQVTEISSPAEAEQQPGALLLKPGSVPAAAANATALEDPRTEPLPLNGRMITLDGPAEIEISDASGQWIRLDPGSGGTQVQIPFAAYEEVGSTKFVFLPDDSTYQVRVLGYDFASADVRIQQMVDDIPGWTAQYRDLPLTPDSQAELSYNPALINPGGFQIDLNGDGFFEGTSGDPLVMNPAESQDFTSPRTTIKVNWLVDFAGTRTGWVEVEMIAEDNTGGTGVQKIEYSLDNGLTVLPYVGKILINSDLTPFVLAKATDRAGNEENPASLVVFGPYSVYLPVLRR